MSFSFWLSKLEGKGEREEEEDDSDLRGGLVCPNPFPRLVRNARTACMHTGRGEREENLTRKRIMLLLLCRVSYFFFFL